MLAPKYAPKYFPNALVIIYTAVNIPDTSIRW